MKKRQCQAAEYVLQTSTVIHNHKKTLFFFNQVYLMATNDCSNLKYFSATETAFYFEGKFISYLLHSQ